MKKFLSAILCIVMIVSSLGITTFATEKTVTLYSLNGTSVVVYESEVDAYTAVGWYKSPMVKLYSNAGKTITVPKDEVESYKKVGWHTNIASVQRTLYSTSGKTITVFKDEVDKYVAVGWYKHIEDTQVNVYSDDGRKMKIFKDQLKSYLSVGWKESLPKTTYISESPVSFVGESLTSGTHNIDVSDFSLVDTYTTADPDFLEIVFSFYYEGSDEFDFLLECYDSKANLLDTVDVYINEYYGYYSLVPSSTAYVKLVPDYNAYEAWSGDFTYKKVITIYGANNAQRQIYDIQFPVYEKSGWLKATKLYSLDDKTIEVSPNEVKKYQALGWYTYDGLSYKYFDDSFWGYYNKRDYSSALDVIDTYKWDFSSPSEYYSSWSKLKYKAMDAWRSSTKCPLGVCSNYIYKDGFTSKINIRFRNVSYKKIIAFKLTFTCYDIFGTVLDKTYTYQCENANLNSGESNSWTWQRYGMSNLHRIGNIKITNVVYADNTLWP